MSHWESSTRDKPRQEPRGLCNVCGQLTGVYYINRECCHCHQGDVIHAGYFHVQDCPFCKGKDEQKCNVCWGMGFTAIPTEDQDDLNRGCQFHNRYCINPWEWWKERRKVPRKHPEETLGDS